MVRLALFQGKAVAPLPMWRRTHIGPSHNRNAHLLRLAQAYGRVGKTMSCASMSAQISAQMSARAVHYSNWRQAGVCVLRATHSPAMGQR